MENNNLPMDPFATFINKFLSSQAHVFNRSAYENIVASIIDHVSGHIKNKVCANLQKGSYKHIIERRNARRYVLSMLESALTYMHMTEHLTAGNIGTVLGPYDYYVTTHTPAALLTAEQHARDTWISFIDSAKQVYTVFDKVEESGTSVESDEIFIPSYIRPPSMTDLGAQQPLMSTLLRPFANRFPESSEDDEYRDDESSPRMLYVGY